MLKRLDMIITSVMLAAFLLVTFLIMRGADYGRPEKGLFTYSTYDTGPDGCRALLLLARKLGYPVKQWKKPFSKLEGTGGLMFCIQPSLPVTGQELRFLREWISRGNTAVFILNASPQLAEEFTIAYDFTGTGREIAVMPPQSPFLEGVHKITVHSAARMSGPDEHRTVYLRDEKGIVAMSYAIGAGSIFFLSDPDIACNSHIAEKDNVVFLANILLMQGPPRTVFFDEYSHGYRENRTLYGVLKHSPAGPALLQIVFAVALLLFAQSRRFGRPIPLQKSTKMRATMEYVKSIARIYQMGGARITVLRELYTQFTRALAHRLGMKGGISPEALLASARKRGNARYEELKKLIEECEEALASGDIREARLLSLAREMALREKERV